MGIYLHKFNNGTELENAYYGDAYVEPWVSLCTDEFLEVNVYGLDQGNDEIRYASEHEVFCDDGESEVGDGYTYSLGNYHLWELSMTLDYTLQRHQAQLTLAIIGSLLNL